jgi:hypothetical protein
LLTLRQPQYSCVTAFISGTDIAGCKPADIACVCRNKDFIGGISCCLQKDCSKEDIESTISFANQLCAASGVDTPKQLVCSSGSASSSSGATKTSSGSAAAATGSPQSTSAPSGTVTTGTATVAATSTKTNAAVPAFANAGGILGAALAMVAAL